MKRQELDALLKQAASEHWAGERWDAMVDALMELIEPRSQLADEMMADIEALAAPKRKRRG